MFPDLPIRGRRVLVVEDEPGLAGWLTKTFAGDGHQVDTTASGLIALDKLREGDYDLIVADLRMAELEGLEAYCDLERERPGILRRIIFVTGREFVTGHEKPADGEVASRAAGIFFLREPFSEDDLRRLSQELLEGALASLPESLARPIPGLDEACALRARIACVVAGPPGVPRPGDDEFST
jgi:CheY-like chemotaxis protein